ncbi:hypothetical protein [Aquisalinus luteolus]|uniref:Uncharacterized protein n=1 Tax=Aquisalinus luteolus TaxID=1566827 RepID=A0A8J3AA99_9PROT|nr:hypothetical protein [Aquisalinus luteolus]GGI01530.1 hypothetical protein GCM10011355_32390 [Aquisalinus luteolus]
MPEDIRTDHPVLSRLGLLEKRLDELVAQFCHQPDSEEPIDRTARTLSTLLRESERIEEMKRKYDKSGQDGDSEYSPAEVERMRAELERRLDRIAKNLEEKVADPAAAGPRRSPDA